MLEKGSGAVVGVAALLLFGLLAGATDAHADEKAEFQRLLKDRADTVVTLKLVLKMKGGFFGADGQEMEREVSAVMIEPQGLVLASSTELGGIPPTVRRMMSRMGGELSVIPSDIKVLVGDDTEGLEGELLARDSDLDLAWVKVKDPGEKTFPALDLSRSVKPELGQRLLAVTRMNKYFDRAPVVVEVRLAGSTTKPRELYVPSGPLSETFCTPVYTPDGTLVGVTVLQFPELDVSADDPFSMSGQMAGLESVMSGFILPAEEVLKATRRAKEVAASQGPEEAPSDKPPKPGDAGKPPG